MPKTASPTPSARSTRPKRWEDLLDVSAALFAEKGYEATSMQDIALDLGVLKGSLYHYIDSKEKILFEIIRKTYDLGVRNVGSVPADLPPEQRIRALVDRHIDFLLNNLAASRVLLHEAGALSGTYRTVVDGQRGDYTDAFRQAIIEGQAQGVFRRDMNADYACNFVLGACNWVYRWHDETPVRSQKALRQQFADMVAAALKAPDPG